MKQINYKVKDCLDLIKGLLKAPKYSQLKVSKRAWIKWFCKLDKNSSKRRSRTRPKNIRLFN